MRDAYLTIVLGTNGTGKSTIVGKQFIDIELKNQNGRVLIVTPDDSEWQHLTEVKNIKELSSFTGIKKVIYTPGTMQVIHNKYKNGLLVFDDFRAFDIEKQTEKEALRKIAIRRRQKSRDTIIIAHGFTDIIPSFLLKYASHYVIFQTLDNIKLKKNYFINYELMERTQAEVNQKAKTKPHFCKLIEIKNIKK